MNQNEAVTVEDISTRILFLFILLFFQFQPFVLPHPAPISQLKSNHRCCNEQPAAAQMLLLYFQTVSYGSCFNQLSTFNCEQVSKQFLLKSECKYWPEWCGECRKASVAASFRVGAVEQGRLQVEHCVGSRCRGGGAGCIIFTFTSTPALSSFSFEFTSYLRFISHAQNPPP